MHPAHIKAALEIAGTNQAKVAEELGVSGSAVNLVINGRSVSRSIAEHIAKKIGKSLDDIWPGRYTDQAA
jgi:lambda repressor-like predicted transcriptional regulator